MSNLVKFLGMKKNKKRGQNRISVAPQEKIKCPISLACLADIYGLSRQALSFAIAETDCGEDGFDFTPVVAIAKSDHYIDLARGIKVQTAHAQNAKQNFFAATVKYENGEIIFSAPEAEAKIAKSALEKKYGTAVTTL